MENSSIISESTPSGSPSSTRTINGIDPVALQGAMAALAENPALAPIAFRAKTDWQGGTASRTQIESYDLAGNEIPHRHTIACDEPVEMLGGNTAANPQELLLAALNACMTVGFVAGATARGIRLDSLSIRSSLELDLRGAFGIDPSIKPGTDCIRYTIEVSGDGDREQFEEIQRDMMATSPNRFHLSTPIRLEPRLIVL